MKYLIHEASKNTPEIFFDDQSAEFVVKGISTPVNAFEFYQQIVDWVDKNETIIPEVAKFHFNMPYFNSATMKALLMLLERIKAGIVSGKSWTIEWFVEDEDEFMLDAAESFQSILGITFSIAG